MKFVFKCLQSRQLFEGIFQVNLQRQRKYFHNHRKARSSQSLKRWKSGTEGGHFEYLSKQSYWKSRYMESSLSGAQFDWFLGTQDLIDALHSHILDVHAKCKHRDTTKLRYLELGCGTSDVPCYLINSCPVPLSMILLDFATEALKFQEGRLSTAETDHDFIALCADATQLPLHDNSLHLVVDKGTLDSVMKDTKNGCSLSQQIVSEVKRVLEPGCRYLQVSDEDPDSRIPFLEQLWSRSVEIEGLSNSKCSEGFQSAKKDGEDTLNSQHLKNSLNTGSRCDASSLPVTSKSIMKDKDSSSSISSESECSQFWCYSSLRSEGEQEYFMYWIDK